MNPIVSVVIPTYNRSQDVVRSIRSVSNQTYGNLEIIVVDDGSTDGSKKAINEMEVDLRYIYQQNRGANAARNTGIIASNGQFISFLDSDDVLDEKHLEKVINKFKECSGEVMGVTTSHRNRFQSGEVKNTSIRPNGEISLENFFERDGIGSFSCVTFKRRVFDEVGLLDEEMPSFQDYEFYLRILEEWKIWGVEEILVDRYLGNDRISTNMSKKISGLRLIKRKYPNKAHDKFVSDAYIAIATKELKNGNRKEALKYIKKAVYIKPDQKDAYFLVCVLITPISINLLIKIKKYIDKNLVDDYSF